MALLHMDGFDSYLNRDDLNWTYSGVGGSYIDVQSTLGRFGGGCVRVTGGNIVKSLPTAPQEIWIGGAIKPADALGTNNADLFSFYSATGREATVSLVPSTGVVTAWRNNNVNLGSSAAGAIPADGAYRWVEVRYKMSATVGVVEVWVAGVRVLNLQNVNTSQNALTALASVYLLTGGIGTWDILLDDLYILDTTGAAPANTRLGDSRIETLKPAADATPNDATPSSAGAHYLMVNENQWNTSNYLTFTGSVSTNAELFDMTDLATTPTAVHGVRVIATSQKSDAGASSLIPTIKSGATSADGASQPLTTSWTQQTSLHTVDPATSAAWTMAGVNALKAGVRVA